MSSIAILYLMERFTNSVRIKELLKRLFERHAILTISINDDQAQKFTSAVIKVSADKDAFYLDELKPDHGHQRLENCPKISIKTQLEGINIAFDANIDSVGKHNGIPYYRLGIPKHVDYHQRRASVRIAMSAAHPLPAVLESTAGEVLEGTVADLSLGGMRIRFTQNIPRRIQPGQQFACSFTLPPDDTQAIKSKLVVRGITHPNDKTSVVFIGGQFTDIAKPCKHQIQKTVMFLQRSAQKKRHN